MSEEFPENAVDWVEFCFGQEVPNERVWGALCKDCAPLPPGQAGVVLCVLEGQERGGVTLLAMQQRLGRKISMSTIEALEKKEWIIRTGEQRGAGWAVHLNHLADCLEMYERVVKRMRGVKRRMEAPNS